MIRRIKTNTKITQKQQEAEQKCAVRHNNNSLPVGLSFKEYRNIPDPTEDLF